MQKAHANYFIALKGLALLLTYRNQQNGTEFRLQHIIKESWKTEPILSTRGTILKTQRLVCLVKSGAIRICGSSVARKWF